LSVQNGDPVHFYAETRVCRAFYGPRKPSARAWSTCASKNSTARQS
jgi:hypothetical protein